MFQYSLFVCQNAYNQMVVQNMIIVLLIDTMMTDIYYKKRIPMQIFIIMSLSLFFIDTIPTTRTLLSFFYIYNTVIIYCLILFIVFCLSS